MLRSHLYLAFGAAGLLTLSAVACGDDSGTGTGGSGANNTTAGKQPPARPSSGGPGDGTTVTFGTSKLYLGIKTRAGVEDPKAWADFGYDLDGQVTEQDFSNHCKPAGNAPPKSVFPDGNQGIDNSFGKYLLPIIKTAASSLGGGDLEATLNESITDGSFNIMMELGALGTQANYNPINAQLFAGKEGTPPDWKLVPEFFSPPLTPGNTVPNPIQSPVRFANSYVNNNTWVSGDKGTVQLSLNISGQSFALNIRSAVISMDLDAARGSATNGVIAGVLDTEELITQVRDVLGPFISCDGSAVDGILNQLRQGSDIMKDGTQNPNATCDGISIGLGFDATKVNVVGVGELSDPAENPCEGGGGTGGNGTGGGGG
jgi:hypothetical protein